MTDGRQREFFDRISDEYGSQYESPEGIMAMEKNRRLETALDLAGFPDTGAVLDVGVGSGEFFARLDPSVRSRAVGLDASREMIRTARANEPSVDFAQGTAVSLPVADGAVGSLVCLGVLGYIQEHELETTIGELARTIDAGGELVLSFANAASLFRRFRQFYYQDVLEAGKRLLGRGDPLEHTYNAYGPEQIAEALEDAGMTVEDRRYLTYATGITDSGIERRMYRYGEKRHRDDTRIGGQAMTWVIRAVPTG